MLINFNRDCSPLAFGWAVQEEQMSRHDGIVASHSEHIKSLLKAEKDSRLAMERAKRNKSAAQGDVNQLRSDKQVSGCTTRCGVVRPASHIPRWDAVALTVTEAAECALPRCVHGRVRPTVTHYSRGLEMVTVMMPRVWRGGGWEACGLDTLTKHLRAARNQSRVHACCTYVRRWVVGL